MAPPLYDFRLSDDQLKMLGRIIVSYSHIDHTIEGVLFVLFARKATSGDLNISMRMKLLKLKELICAGEAPELEALHKELRWAMRFVQVARNMICHGILIYPDSKLPEFWSTQRLKKISFE